MISRPRPLAWVGIATSLLGHRLQSAMYRLPSPTLIDIFSASFNAQAHATGATSSTALWLLRNECLAIGRTSREVIGAI